MTALTRMLSLVSLYIASPHNGVSASKQHITGTASTYRLERARGRLEKNSPRFLQMDFYDGLFDERDVEDWEYHFYNDANRKHTYKSCGGKGVSCAPTQFPSVSPSSYPTRSSTPSAVPSLMPSSLPSQSPSSLPSFQPTKSPMPSRTPSSSPSLFPSDIPSQVPTKYPSSSPSIRPTVSHMPSSQPTESPVTYEQEEGSTGAISNCVDQPLDDEGIIRDQILAFQYNLYTTLEANFDQELATMESSLHNALSQLFLTCDYNTGKPFYIISINAAPDDSLSDSTCDTTNDPTPARKSKCAVVTAKLTMVAYFPRRRILQSTSANPEIIVATSDYLKSSMNSSAYETAAIVQVTFQGFLNSQDESRDTPSGGVAGIVGNENPPSNVTENRAALGGVVVGLAAMILVLILFAGGHRRKLRQEAYLKHLEDLSEAEIEESEDSRALGDGRVHLVIDDSDFNNISGMSGTPSAILRDLDASHTHEHDFHRCNSATCPVCQNQRIDPIFLHTHNMDRERLRAIAAIRNSYRSPDTVDL